MKRFIFSILTVGLILGLSGCGSSPEDSLQSSIDKYKKCTIDNDFKCVAKLTDPSLVETMGGIDGFSKLMKSSGITILAINIKNIAPIKKDGNILSSRITYTQTAKVHDEKMSMDSSFIASSKDDGKTWFFSTQQ